MPRRTRPSHSKLKKKAEAEREDPAFRRENQCNEDQRSQSAGQGRDQDASGTPPDIGIPDGPPPAKSATSSLDPLTPDPKSTLGKLEGYPCRFLLDSGAVKSLVNPKAFPDLFRKIRARSSSIKLLSAERRKMKAIGETSLRITIGKESWTLQIIMCPELVWDAILVVDFLRNTGAILNFAEGTFTTQQHKAIKSVEPSQGKDADEIRSALFEAAGIPVNNLGELCSQLTRITDSERKELHSLLRRYSRMFAWQGTKLGRTNIIKHAIDTGEAKSIMAAPGTHPFLPSWKM
ncbi:Retroviral-like aspartic protease 1 [Taenia solium]|eukprot:TsM_001063100 transcript=TsM_001063100 gene=TsM_001063100